MKLLGERILVKKVEKRTSIILPDKVMIDEIIEGEVVALGNMIKAEPLAHGCHDLEIGDVIQWNVHAGTWAKIEGQVVCILRPNDVVCILTEEYELAS